VLIPLERSGASVQRRYITSGNFDFCIDDGRRVALLTSDSNVWSNIEAGTRIVMRVIFQQLAFFSPEPTYECHLCGAWNKLVSVGWWLFEGSREWFVLLNSLIKTYLTWISHGCKGRFQISLDRDREKQGRNDGIDTETRHCIRNFRVKQIVCIG